MDRGSSYGAADKAKDGGCFTKEQCAELAKKIMELYDTNKDGYLEPAEVANMLSDSQRAKNRAYNPSQEAV